MIPDETLADPPDDPDPPPPPGTGPGQTSQMGLRVAGIVTSLPLLFGAIVWFATRDAREERRAPPTEPAPSADRLAPRELTTAEGQTLTLPDPEAKATVLVFTSTTCPIANGFAPEIQRLDAEFLPQGIRLVLVETETDITAETARAHAVEYGYTCPVLVDPEGTLAKAAGATMTPEAAVLSPKGEILYRGRIDDRFPAVGQRRAAPHHTELRDALAAVLAGKRVAVPRTEAVGCYIEQQARSVASP